MDLISASIVTNTALEVARGIEEEALPTITQVANLEVMQNALNLCLCKAHGEYLICRTGQDMNFRCTTSPNPSFGLLFTFCNRLSKGLARVRSCRGSRKGFTEHTSKGQTAPQKDVRGKYGEDKIVLRGILPEFCLIIFAGYPVPIEDELTRGLRTPFPNGEVTMSTVLAAQVYPDVHHILREDIGKGLLI